MAEKDHRGWTVLLLAGDFMTIALITVIGFARHDELGSAGTRMLTTFVPLVVGWLAAAPFLGAYSLENTLRLTQLWRPFWAMVIGAPLAAWLRGVWLGSAILPVFVAVLGGIASLAILVWRFIYYYWAIRRRSS